MHMHSHTIQTAIWWQSSSPNVFFLGCLHQIKQAVN